MKQKIYLNKIKDDCCVYGRSLVDDFFIFLLLVNYMLIVTNYLYDVYKLKTKLGNEFNLKDLGAAKKIFGMKIHRICSSQKSYDRIILSFLWKTV